MAFPMLLEQQIACILQSKHQQIQKMPRREQESCIYNPTVNIEAVCSANITHYVLTNHLSDVHRLFINWHIPDGCVGLLL